MYYDISWIKLVSDKIDNVINRYNNKESYNEAARNIFSILGLSMGELRGIIMIIPDSKSKILDVKLEPLYELQYKILNVLFSPEVAKEYVNKLKELKSAMDMAKLNDLQQKLMSLALSKYPNDIVFGYDYGT
ncbi:MAG: hypothetical protein ACTSPY_12220 [Candidatus Helarchaeota archaeon]